MPTYDYECTECGHAFEHFQMMSDNPLTDCPECGGALRRLIGGGMGIIFRGSGFYVTDNKSAKRSSGVATDVKPTENKTASDTKPSEPEKSKQEKPVTT